MSALVTCAIAGGVATVALNNPDRRNAMSVEMADLLGETLSEIAASPAVRAVVLTGAGSAFCVGTDLSGASGKRAMQGNSVAEDTARLRKSSRVVEQIYHLPQPVIAAINGPCAGAGLSLAAAADFRIAAGTAVFNTAFLTAGFSGDLAGIWFLTHALGGARARELFLTPGKFDAARAERIGLVSEVLPAAELAAAAGAMAERIAASAPIALRAMKANLIEAQTAALGDYVGVEVDRMVHCFYTEDAKEAASAFLEKRLPVFTGR